MVNGDGRMVSTHWISHTVGFSCNNLGAEKSGINEAQEHQSTVIHEYKRCTHATPYGLLTLVVMIDMIHYNGMNTSIWKDQ